MAWWRHHMGPFFRVTVPLTGDQWIPITKARDAELWCFLDLRLNKRLSKQSRRWWFEKISRSLLHHCNELRRPMQLWEYPMITTSMTLLLMPWIRATPGSTNQIIDYAGYMPLGHTRGRFDLHVASQCSFRPAARVPQCTNPVPHGAPLCNWEVHMCTSLLRDGV